MPEPDPSQLRKSPKIMIAPLNWGLGHAARCIPLIQALMKRDIPLVLASDGAALRLLQAEFPTLPSAELPSYGIRYASHNMVRNIAGQLPRIVWAVRTEQWATERLVHQYGIQGIISDNRYGCFSAKIPSIMLTHQLNLRVPQSFLQWSANQVLHKALRQFDAIWIPDAQGDANLSGELSHPAPKQIPPVTYIGPLSRMQPQSLQKEYDAAIILSGPEPQRSRLEQILLEQAMVLPQKFIVVQGKTQQKTHQFMAENVEVVSYLTSEELNRVIAASQVVVCRSGYSSLMDLVALGKKALIIPTPGQSEQEYLATYLAHKRLFCTQTQDNIDLKAGLALLVDTPTQTLQPQASETAMGFLDKWLEEMST
jgi:uncharacterized protein (TIGR00661 family)